MLKIAKSIHKLSDQNSPKYIKFPVKEKGVMKRLNFLHKRYANLLPFLTKLMKNLKMIILKENQCFIPRNVSIYRSGMSSILKSKSRPA